MGKHFLSSQAAGAAGGCDDPVTPTHSEPEVRALSDLYLH